MQAHGFDFLDCHQWWNWIWFLDLFFFLRNCGQCANSFFSSSSWANPTASRCPLWTAVPLSLRLRQTIVQMDRWTCSYLHRCWDRDVHAGWHRLAFPSIFLSPCKSFHPPSCLPNPHPSSSAAVPPITKGFFVFKGPQKPLGTQSEH